MNILSSTSSCKFYFSMLLVPNSLHDVTIMTFESILGVFLFKTSMFQRIEN